jgi:hypothetical protein
MSPSDDSPGATSTSTDLPALTVNLGPLTTTFTPLPDCTSLRAVYWGRSVLPSEVYTLVNLERGYSCARTLAEARTECLPMRWGAAYNHVNQNSGVNNVYPVYSPGLVCPAGYSTGCVMVYSTKGGADTATRWSILQPGESAIGCCPT